ncbi:MAG: phage major capsid protein, partial [Firmicutes bacterium]|nr:phage major capsid protein [Bacillota bacterium]
LASTLKNLYGYIEITDKAVRASAGNTGAFVNLLNLEMDNLMRTCNFNLSRMFYGDGTGKLTDVISQAMSDNWYEVSTPGALAENMKVDYMESGVVKKAGLTITNVYMGKQPYIRTNSALPTGWEDGAFYIPGTFNMDMNGLESCFKRYVYGVDTNSNTWLKSGEETVGGWLNEDILGTACDKVEIRSGQSPTHILTSLAGKNYYAKALMQFRRNIDVLNLEGGYKAVSFKGIPVIGDKFCPERSAYVININDFKIFQLCDWSWIEGDAGKILHQNPGTATYSATLVKYADMMCVRPGCQYALRNIYNLNNVS